MSILHLDDFILREIVTILTNNCASSFAPYLTTNLRETCVRFARLIAAPRVTNGMYLAMRAIREDNVQLLDIALHCATFARGYDEIFVTGMISRAMSHAPHCCEYLYNNFRAQWRNCEKMAAHSLISLSQRKLIGFLQTNLMDLSSYGAQSSHRIYCHIIVPATMLRKDSRQTFERDFPEDCANLRAVITEHFAHTIERSEVRETRGVSIEHNCYADLDSIHPQYIRRLDHWIQFGPNKIAESRILFARYGLQRKNANTPLFRELNLVRPPFRAKIVKYLRHIDELREILNMTTYNNERLSRAIQKIRHGEAIVNNRAQWIGELQSHMTRTMFDCFLHANPFRRIFYARIIP